MMLHTILKAILLKNTFLFRLRSLYETVLGGDADLDIHYAHFLLHHSNDFAWRRNEEISEMRKLVLEKQKSILMIQGEAINEIRY